MAKQPAAATETLYGRFRRLLPPVVDLELVVLKGHLLIEEQLRTYLRNATHKPESVVKAHLNFMQAAHLVRALGGLLGEHDLWTLVVGLNKLRNRLAHTPEPGDIAADIDNILRNYWHAEFTKPDSPRQRATRLRQTLAMNVALLAGSAAEAGWRIRVDDQNSHHLVDPDHRSVKCDKG